MLLAHERFERVASATPEAPAVRFQGASLSYGELNARANQLARKLLDSGVGPESRVVVSLEPGFEIVIALLAILKAGGVYVPLDPSYPQARKSAILSDTAPQLVLTGRALEPQLAQTGISCLALDQALPELAQLDGSDVRRGIEPEQTAYIYYTSGTTGVPKGVMASHTNLASYIGSAQERYGFTSTDVIPAIARFGFSISMFELMNPLVAGGTLLLLERAHVLDLARLSETLRQATFFHAGPALLRSLLKYIKQHYRGSVAFHGIRHASSGGDMVPVELLEELRDVFPKAEIYVIYGCSEISCMGTTYEVPRVVPLHKTYVGKPFAGVTVELLDEQLQPVGAGEVGEVWFAGPGVVKGYLNRPELNAERFALRQQQRFYRTGDRGRFNSQGLLELLGRSDFQVKLGGIRIELGEIEHHLRRAPSVENAVVVARSLDEGDDKALVAYVVTEAGAAGDSHSRASAIRRHLAEQLPDYMLPAVIVELDALPLNHNQKLDRRALPDPPRASRRRFSQVGRLPRTETEQRLAALWRQVLGVQDVGLDDNFFDLGGQSLSALTLIVLVDQELGATLSGLELLREPLEIIARLCDSRTGKSTPRSDTSERSSSNGEAVELFHFGAEQSLFGVLHRAAATRGKAALICAPLGHEYLRSHFVLQRLARQLAAAGIPTLRFDYFGSGDSLGSGAEATLERWQSDIAAAYQELIARTGAQRVVAIGARFGANLLASVSDALPLQRLVFWDPIEQGSEYLAELQRADERLRRRGPARAALARAQDLVRGRCELLGAGFRLGTLRAITDARLPTATALACPTHTLRTDAAWLEVTEIEDMLPDLGISPALARLVEEAA